MGTTMKLLCLLAFAAHSSALLTSPPRIVKQPTMEEQLFMVAQPGEADKPFIIECEAEGEPAPQYRWVKNGKPFQYASYADRMSQQPGRGSLVVSKPKDEDMGQYQCFAYNEWGVATSNSVFVRKAELNSFKDTGDGQQKLLTAQEGRPFKLTCHPPDGWPKPNVYWMLQGDQGQLKTINNSRMTLDPEGNLWFSNVTRFDASEDTNLAYTCAAKSLFRNEYKLGNKVFLKVKQTGGISPTQNKYPPEEQYTTRRNEVALRGKKAELYCIYGGTPLPQIVWKKDGSNILSSSRVTQDNYGKTLVINPVTNVDKGTYTCEVSNGVGSAQSHSINLNIKAAPYFTIAPESLNLAENETAVIRCKADGSPEPQIKWVYNGEPIERAPSNPRRTVAADSITIVGLVKKDTGNYGCNATNSIGYVYKDVYINVQSIPPEIREGPENVTKVDGSEVVMRCRVFGAPRPIVKWMRNDVELTGGNFNITTEGDLVIRKVGYGDAGLYRCYAQNSFGEKSAYGSLDVKQKSIIKNEPENYEVAAGSQATFRCTPDTDPDLRAEVTWEFKGQTIDFESQPRFKMTNDYSLLISDTIELDSGPYTCIVRTPIDEASAQATLIVQDRPNAPLLKDIQCGEKVANLAWEPQGDNRAPIIRFSIQYNTTFTPDIWDLASDTVPASQTTWAVELSPWANYTFRVIAHNKIGPSAPSRHSEVCTTQPDVPHKNPDKVEGRGRAPNNMVIFWSKMPQIEHNGPGFYYQVSFKRNDTGEGWTDQTVQDWRQSELLVPNTPTFVPYKIKVVAWNSKGASDVTPVEVIGWSGEDKPLYAPTNFTLVEVMSGNEALLSWNPVPPESVRGHFNGYRIQTWTDGEEDQVREFKAKSDATKVMINILKPHKKNNVRIMVYNGFDNGPPSDTLSFVTPEGKPGPVRTFNAYPIGSSAMLLTWDKPMEENGVLIGYKVYYAKTVGTAVEPWVERKKLIDSKFDRAKLAGLQPDTKYRIELRAMTKAGEGKGYFVEQATRSERTAQPDVPLFEARAVPPERQAAGAGQPPAPAPTGKAAANVLVRWLPALDGHPGTHFQASYKLKGYPQWEQWQIETEDDYVIIRGLQPNKIYEVKVTAYDGDYFTDSEIKEVDTTNDGPLIMPDSDRMAQAGWFIGVMLALAFLLLVLVLVCVARRNRGGKYDVHDRELAAGRRDHPDTGFHEYTHPLDNKSRHSMSSGNKPGPESDTDSMAEYGEGETGRFTEDGSFIGQYVPGARALPPAPPAPPAHPAPPATAAAPATRSGPQPPTYV